MNMRINALLGKALIYAPLLGFGFGLVAHSFGYPGWSWGGWG
jgi:hypothetical protein